MLISNLKRRGGQKKATGEREPREVREKGWLAGSRSRGGGRGGLAGVLAAVKRSTRTRTGGEGLVVTANCAHKRERVRPDESVEEEAERRRRDGRCGEQASRARGSPRGVGGAVSHRACRCAPRRTSYIFQRLAFTHIDASSQSTKGKRTRKMEQDKRQREG